MKSTVKIYMQQCALVKCLLCSQPEAYSLQVCAEEHQRYLLFSSLLRHVSSAGLDTAQQTAVVDLAAAEGRALEGGLASSALVLAVKVLSSPCLYSSPHNN